MAKLPSESGRPFLGGETAWLLHVICLIGLCGVLYFPYLGSVPFFDKGEPREALTVQDIVQRGDWLVPLKRATDIPSKPPLFHWSAALVSRLTGSLTEATIRFPSALYATLGVLVIYALGRKMFDPRTALLAGAILATMIIYQGQALRARVDMTLCFFVTLNLSLFYGLYRGFLASPLWFYAFYTLVGIGTLAKGPLGLVLPALVAGSFALVCRRWDRVKQFCLHPGVVLTVALASVWYVVAVARGGAGFFDRQILEENLSRFAGGSGHTHPVYYYFSYLFSQSLPWGFFLPVLLWDLVRNDLRKDEGALFLKLWLVVMFAFFSLSLGKRTVYLLPIYPALSLLFAAWFYDAAEPRRGRMLIYRGIAILTGLAGAVLLVVTIGALWNHSPGWFFTPIEGLLKPKDRANLITVQNQLDDFGWSFNVVELMAAVLWLSVTRSLWLGKIRAVAHQLIWAAVVHGFIAWAMVMPVIAAGKSYQNFMTEVNRLVNLDEKLFVYGVFNSDELVFYRGEVIKTLNRPPEEIAGRIGKGAGYLIMAEQDWKEMRGAAGTAPPLLTSTGTGPEGDARLVLLRVDPP
jgi:hypothetical protein